MTADIINNTCCPLSIIVRLVVVVIIAIMTNPTPRNPESLRPVVFCGPSGVGKGTLIEMLMKRFPENQFGFSVSHTTRAPREGEKDGVHYHFTTVDAIKKEIEEGKFIEYAEVHGKYYGTR